MELFKLLNVNEVVTQLMAFLILLFLLRAFAWKRVLGILDARKERISSEFKKIDEAKTAAEALGRELQAKIASIEKIAGQKIQEAVVEGKKITDEMRKKAYEDAQDIIMNAKESIKSELSVVKEELKDEIINLTVEATAHIVREKFTEEDDRLMIKDFLEKLDKA